jgi:hypothetical protein
VFWVVNTSNGPCSSYTTCLRCGVQLANAATQREATNKRVIFLIVSDFKFEIYFLSAKEANIFRIRKYRKKKR